LLAASNPKGAKGAQRFDEHGRLGEQLNLQPTLVSRFDVIFPLLDKPETNNDKRITDHIIRVHRRGQAKKATGEKLNDEILENTSSVKPVYNVETLRKYVAYSKRITPVMSEEAAAEIRNAYLKIRMTGGGKSTVPITARQLEAYIRLAEASARARLSDIVTQEDALRSIRLIHYSLDKIHSDLEGTKTVWDSDVIATGISANFREEMEIVRETIREFTAMHGFSATRDELYTELRKKIGDYTQARLIRALDQLMSDGVIYSPTIGKYSVA
ncbi:MAG: ATPase, partial [Methanomassiliicoccaceae archaeon]|nr:ATPase [Methanomassiliicoccaceae archaeon]